jgi:4'-phosphopantetheinyl transferase EntD
MRAVAPGWVRYDVRPISDEWIAQLHPDEAALARSFAPGRRTEFATGRASVRSLFPERTPADRPILIGDRRAPVVPPGLHASISHCEAVVATVATEAFDIRGIGVDIERSDRVTPDLAGVILSRSEAETVPAPSLARSFSAKEAVFKAIHGSIGRYIDFLDIALTFRSDRFAARPLFADPNLDDVTVEGRVAEAGRYVLAIAWASRARASA